MKILVFKDYLQFHSFPKLYEHIKEQGVDLIIIDLSVYKQMNGHYWIEYKNSFLLPLVGSDFKILIADTCVL